MTKFKLSIAALLSTLALAACDAPTNLDLAERQKNYNKGEAVIVSLIGEGACLRCFNIYRGMNHEKAFAISRSGVFGHTNSKKTSAEAKKGALASCRARNKANESSKPCRLLMVGDRYVWNGGV